MGLSFATTKELRSRLEILPKVPQWKSKPWPTEFVKRPLTLFYRDPLECLQSLLLNPLVQDHIDYSPFRLYKSAAETMRIFTEWFSGDDAWEKQVSGLFWRLDYPNSLGIQKLIPDGATLIGAVAGTDKTQITSMTGNRVAHPLLLSTANIQMEYRMKASNYMYSLCAILPVAIFTIKDKKLRGVLANRLYHACMDDVFAPLKKAAQVGVVLADAFGRLRMCFTPLASHIVDTPESLMVAGVAANQSSVTTASSKQFGDPFRHPARTAKHTLDLIEKLEKDVEPWDLPKYVKSAKEMGLNGVHRPYWRDWPMSDPSTFLTPEILHHWLKMFWDHQVKWCLQAASADELDFRFSVLRPLIGVRHFKAGISKAKQVTGREHRDILRYIVAVIAEAEGINNNFLTAIRSLVDFQYLGQAPKIDEGVLSQMDDALKTFHEEKWAILEAEARMGKAGPIEHWHIPKLEFLQSVVPSIRASGVPLQWSADVTERAHIPLIKQPASRSNNQNHEQQICRNLDRRDKVAQFELATAMVKAGVDLGFSNSDPDESDEEDSDEEGPRLVSTTSELRRNIKLDNESSRVLVNYFAHSAKLLCDKDALRPFRTFVSSQDNTAFQVGRDHVGCQLNIEAAANKFLLPGLEPALGRYLYRVSNSKKFTLGGRPEKNETLPSIKLKTWYSVRIQSRAFHDRDQILSPETVSASPPDSDWKSGRGDAVIVNSDEEYTWPYSGLQGRY